MFSLRTETGEVRSEEGGPRVLRVSQGPVPLATYFKVVVGEALVLGT